MVVDENSGGGKEKERKRSKEVTKVMSETKKKGEKCSHKESKIKSKAIIEDEDDDMDVDDGLVNIEKNGRRENPRLLTLGRWKRQRKKTSLLHQTNSRTP